MAQMSFILVFFQNLLLQGETWEVSNLFVCDTSLFPTSSGANPMVTVESIAYMVANKIAKKIKTESEVTEAARTVNPPMKSSL